MLPNSLTFLFKSSIFCCSNFGHLQTQESKDGIYMKIKKHFTFLIHVTFKKLLSWGWWMLNWQLRRLASLFIAKERAGTGQPPTQMPSQFLIISGSSLPCHHPLGSSQCWLFCPPYRDAHGRIDKPGQMPSPRMSVWSTNMRFINMWPYEGTEKCNTEGQDTFSRIMPNKTGWGRLVPGSRQKGEGIGLLEFNAQDWRVKMQQREIHATGINMGQEWYLVQNNKFIIDSFEAKDQG